MKTLSKDDMEKLITPELMKEKSVPVRFMENGFACNITTGAKMKGNVMNQPVYWLFPKTLSLRIAKATETKAVFSE